MTDITIEAPIPPRGKGRPRMTRSGIVYTPKATRAWEATLAALAEKKRPKEVIEGPLRVDVVSVQPRPQSMVAQWKRPRAEGYGDGTYKHPLGLLWCPQKPDVDNVAKGVLDALKAFWRDDKQVVELRAVSVYAEQTGRPRVIVRIREHVGLPALIVDSMVG